MKHAFYTLLLAFGIFQVTSLGQITTGVPDFISYQGKVLDSSGGLVGFGTPVNRTVTFRIWNHASNTLIENLIYSEEQTVTIAEGEFSVLVGQGVATSNPIGDPETDLGPPITSIADAFNGEARYLGVTIDDGTAAADNEISPRQQIVSSAFAFRAKYAETLGTNANTALTVLDSGNIGVGTSAPTGKFEISSGPVAGSVLKLTQPLTTWITEPTFNDFRFISTGGGDPNLVGSMDFNVGAGGVSIGYPNVPTYGSADALYVNGNVGIGTSAPLAKLDVLGDARVASFRSSGAGNRSAYIQCIDDGSSAVSVLFGADGNGFSGVPGQGGLGTWTNHPLKIFTNATERMAITANGNVGIGTNAPTQARLVVSGTNGVESLGAHGYLNTSGAGTFGAVGNVSDVSIRATHAVHASHFRAVSDARIKDIVGRSDGEADLAVLNQIEITDYTHKDVISKGKATSKKVIAQQVERVFPQAVGKTVDVIPDIYTKAPVDKGWITLATDLKKGERVRLISTKKDEIVEVLEVKEDRFRTEFDLEGEEALFVYGREVDDFRVVEYEAIAMLNVSATQQIKKEKDAEIAALQKENADLRERLTALDSANKARDKRLSAIEKLLTTTGPTPVISRTTTAVK